VGAVGSSGDEVGGAMVRQYMLPGNHGSTVHSPLGRRETQLLATLHMVDVRFRVDHLEFRCLLKPWTSLTTFCIISLSTSYGLLDIAGCNREHSILISWYPGILASSRNPRSASCSCHPPYVDLERINSSALSESSMIPALT
jgi:hypothetical protein